MSLMTMLLIVWGVLTGALVILLIYRSTLTIHEDDQLFLDDAESHMQAEQTELLNRMNQIQPFVRLLGIASVGLIAVIGGIWIYQGIMQNRL
jgi:Tfp pilus assembly protein PilN